MLNFTGTNRQTIFPWSFNSQRNLQPEQNPRPEEMKGLHALPTASPECDMFV